MLNLKEIMPEVVRVVESYGLTIIPTEKAIKQCNGYMKLLSDGNFYYYFKWQGDMWRIEISWNSYHSCWSYGYFSNHNEACGGSGYPLQKLDDIEHNFIWMFKCHNSTLPTKVEKQYDLFDFI